MDPKNKNKYLEKFLTAVRSLDTVQLVLVCAGTLAVLGVLIFGIVSQLHKSPSVKPADVSSAVSAPESLPPVIADGSSDDIVIREEKIDNLACYGVYADEGIAIMLRDGTVVTDDIYYKVDDYVGEDGLLAVGDSTPVLSYIDYRTGNTVIKTEYAAGSVMSNGFAAVSVNDPVNAKYYIYGIINKKGELIHDFDLQIGNKPCEGLSLAKPGDPKLYGYVDNTGKYAIAPQFTNAGSFHDGVAPAAKDGKWGFIDKTGSFVIKPAYDKVAQFAEGYAKVCVGEKWGFIDKSGNYIAQPQFEECEDFKNGAAAVKYGGLYGYINTKGQFIIEPQFQEAYGFFCGLASVKTNDKFGYIDVTGKVVIEAKYSSTFDFYEGIARVKEGEAYYYIDVSGKPINDLKYTTGTDFVDGTAIVSTGDRYGIIDKQGKYIVEPQYKSIKNVLFYEDK